MSGAVCVNLPDGTKIHCRNRQLTNKTRVVKVAIYSLPKQGILCKTLPFERIQKNARSVGQPGFCVFQRYYFNVNEVCKFNYSSLCTACYFLLAQKVTKKGTFFARFPAAGQPAPRQRKRPSLFTGWCCALRLGC